MQAYLEPQDNLIHIQPSNNHLMHESAQFATLSNRERLLQNCIFVCLKGKALNQCKILNLIVNVLKQISAIKQNDYI